MRRGGAEGLGGGRRGWGKGEGTGGAGGAGGGYIHYPRLVHTISYQSIPFQSIPSHPCPI